MALVEINDVDELQAIKDALSGDYILGNDIDAAATSGWNEGCGFIPIGDPGTPFTGNFDGDGYVITDLFIDRNGNFQGLFGYTDYIVEIKNVGMVDVSITGDDDVGGLLGLSTGTVTNCYSTGSVSGSSIVGGLVGSNISATITNCYSTGSVSGTDNVGGLFGRGTGTITNCYSTGSVSGDENVGGLIGNNYEITITNCYSTGSVSGANYVGGLIGYDSRGTYNDCFWDTETSGQDTSDGGTGESTADMMKQATFTNWDFTDPDTWDITEDTTYPWLAVFNVVAEGLSIPIAMHHYKQMAGN